MPRYSNLRKIIASFLTFSLFGISIPSFGIEVPTRRQASPSGKREPSSRRSSNHQNMSPYLKQCERWAALVDNTVPWTSVLASNNFSNYINEAKEKIFTQDVLENELDPTNEGDLPKIIKNAGDYLIASALCGVYIAATDPENYKEENREDFNAKDSESQGANSNAALCAKQSTAAAMQQCLAQAQSQQNLSCKHYGWETHDYLSCKKVIQWLQVFTVGESVMKIQQNYRQSSQQNEAYESLLEQKNTEDGIKVSDTLNVEKEAYEQKSELSYEMAGYKSAQAIALMALINAFPNNESMFENCTSRMSSLQINLSFDHIFYNYIKCPFNLDVGSDANRKEKCISSSKVSDHSSQGENAPGWSLILNGQEEIQRIYESYFPSTKDAANELCELVINETENYFILNTQVRDQMKKVAVESGLAALARGAEGALFKQQAGIIKDAITDIEEYEAPDFEITPVADSTVDECLVDSDAEGCELTNDTVTKTGFGTQSFNSNINGGATLGEGTLSDSEEGSGTNSAGVTERAVVPKSLGNVQIGSTKGNSFVDGKVKAGSIKGGKGGNGASGGGGGGGAGSAGLPGGGGSVAGAGRSGAKGARSGKTAVKVAREGSGLGRVSGGRGSIGKKVSSSSNPFAKLLSKASKAKSSTLNFRSPSSSGIGSKKGTLFQMISNRYKVVSSKDKLLKYKAVPRK